MKKALLFLSLNAFCASAMHAMNNSHNMPPHLDPAHRAKVCAEQAIESFIRVSESTRVKISPTQRREAMAQKYKARARSLHKALGVESSRTMKKKPANYDRAMMKRALGSLSRAEQYAKQAGIIVPETPMGSELSDEITSAFSSKASVDTENTQGLLFRNKQEKSAYTRKENELKKAAQGSAKITSFFAKQ